MNWTTIMEHHAVRSPDRVAFRCDDEAVTYAEMARRVAALAGGLRGCGVRKGDVVALLSHNSLAFVECCFAITHLGAVVMPINWRLAADEVGYVLRDAGAVALLAGVESLLLAAAAADGLDLVRVVLGPAETPPWIPLDDLRTEPVAPEPVGGSDLQRLMYTSGTTSRPKGVMITADNVAWKSSAHVVEFDLTSADQTLVCGPLYHVGGLDLGVTNTVYAGGSTVIHRRFAAAEVVGEIERSRITTLWLAPAMINEIVHLDGVGERDLRSLRVLIDGGEKMPVPLIQRVLDVFPSAWFADAYGLTETVSGDTFLDKGSTLHKLGSVGKPCLHVEVAVWDHLDQPVPAGRQGEVVLRGPKVFAGYWNNEQATREAFRGGWFHTGDAGYLDEDGYLFLVDRLKDIIVSGGENIASPEVERVLYEHPGVMEAAVVGRPDERWGEVPIAVVVRRDGTVVGEADLVAHCAERLARFKVPKAVRFVAALPRNPSGKVLKRELRAGGDVGS